MMQAFVLDQNSEFHETERDVSKSESQCTSFKVIISIDLFFTFGYYLTPVFGRYILH